MIFSQLALCVSDVLMTAASVSFSLTGALAPYHRMKGVGQTSVFFESSERSMRYLIECTEHDSLTKLNVSDESLQGAVSRQRLDHMVHYPTSP